MRKSKILNPGYIYVLALGESQYYVGETNNLKRRLQEHVTGLFYDTKKRKWVIGGSVMTRQVKPHTLIGLYRPNLSYIRFKELVHRNTNMMDLDVCVRNVRTETETELTLQYMEIYGKSQVKGAHWCSPDKTPKQETIESLKNSSRPLCKCDIPAEKIINHLGKEKWVCGTYFIHEMFGKELIPSKRGLLLPITEHLTIKVSLSCDCDRVVDQPVFLSQKNIAKGI